VELMQDRTLQMGASSILFMTSIFYGEVERAFEQLERVRALYDRAQHPHYLRYFMGQDPGVMALVVAGTLRWLQGRGTEALEASREGLTLARELGHPFSLAMAVYYTTWLNYYRRDVEATRRSAEETLALCREHGFRFWIGGATLLLGWTMARSGETAAGLVLMREGASAAPETGARINLSNHLVRYAEELCLAGELDEGLARIEEARENMERTGVRIAEAELHRIRGELLSRQSPVFAQEAEGCFLRAREVARRQGLFLYDLRAALGLARLWRLQGRGQQARELVSEARDLTPPAFETVETRQADALLHEPQPNTK
jgi:predicted ATPase